MKKIFCFLLLPFFSVSILLADAPAEKSSADKDTKASDTKKSETKDSKGGTKEKWLKVKTELFESIVELDGLIESKQATPIQLRTKSWTELSVVKAMPHGTVVKKGEILLELDSKKLEKSIETNEAAIPLAQLKLEVLESGLALIERKRPLELAAKQEIKTQGEEDFAYFKNVQKPMSIREAKESLKSSENYLSYSKEELRQLKKMYSNDDLTEETEEIILKRAQDSVDRDTWGFERNRVRTDRSLSILIPREEDRRIRKHKLNHFDWAVAEETLDRELKVKQLELAAQKQTLTKSEEKLADLKNDLLLMKLEAPSDGLLYYGVAQRGKWITASSVEKKMLPGGRLSSTETLFTIVDPDRLQIRVAVPEAKLKELKQGQSGKTKMKWDDAIEFSSEIESLSYIPQANSTYDCVFSFDKDSLDAPVSPGMSVKIKIEAYRNEKAIIIPESAIKEEQDLYYVVLKDGTKRYLELGRREKTKREVLSGLKVGDEVELGDTSDKKAK